MIRCDEAWKILQETNQFNDPPGEGREYVLVHVAGTYSGDEDTDINQFYFRLTGDSSVAASPASLVEPDPQFPDAVTPGAEFESWISFDVKAEESSLLLIFQPSFTADDSANRFLALEPDAIVTVNYDDLPVPTDAGRLRSAPVPIGETTIDTMWELTALDLIRGDAALALVREASPFSDDPAPGYEYAVVKVRARNVSRNPEAADISSYTLSLTGNENVLYGTALVADPAPALRYEVFPGGTVEGWAVYEIRQADTGLMVVRTELFAGFGNDDARYLALEDNAGVDPVGDPLAEPSDLGTERESPVPSGEAAIAGAFEIQILNVFRGQEALDLVAEASVFNDPPEEGLEYVVVQLRVRNVSGEDQAVAVNEFSFKLIGESGESLDLPLVRNPQPDIDADLFPGGVHEGLDSSPNDRRGGGLKARVQTVWVRRRALLRAGVTFTPTLPARQVPGYRSDYLSNRHICDPKRGSRRPASLSFLGDGIKSLDVETVENFRVIELGFARSNGPASDGGEEHQKAPGCDLFRAFTDCHRAGL